MGRRRDECAVERNECDRRLYAHGGDGRGNLRENREGPAPTVDIAGIHRTVSRRPSIRSLWGHAARNRKRQRRDAQSQRDKCAMRHAFIATRYDKCATRHATSLLRPMRPAPPSITLRALGSKMPISPHGYRPPSYSPYEVCPRGYLRGVKWGIPTTNQHAQLY